MAKRFSINATTIATMTAVAAIILGIIDSMQTRAHNRLSVVPYLVCDYSVSGQTEQSIFSVNLNNEGVGPAIIESVRITLPPSLGGRTYGDWNAVAELLRERGAQVPTYWNFEGGEALGVQRRQELVRVVLPGNLARELLPELTKMNVEVVYRSIYREEFRAALRS